MSEGVPPLTPPNEIACSGEATAPDAAAHPEPTPQAVRPRPLLRFDVLTLFPEIFQGYQSQSLLKLALQAGLVEINLWNIRDWARGSIAALTIGHLAAGRAADV